MTNAQLLHEATAHLSLLLLSLHRFERDIDIKALPQPAALQWVAMIMMRETAFSFVQEQTNKTMGELEAQFCHSDFGRAFDPDSN